MSKQMTDDQGAPLALLTAKETGKKLRRAEKTLANWRSGGVGPAYIKVSAGRSGRVLYVAADVDRWIYEHRVDAAEVTRDLNDALTPYPTKDVRSHQVEAA